MLASNLPILISRIPYEMLDDKLIVLPQELKQEHARCHQCGAPNDITPYELLSSLDRHVLKPYFPEGYGWLVHCTRCAHMGVVTE